MKTRTNLTELVHHDQPAKALPIGRPLFSFTMPAAKAPKLSDEEKELKAKEKEAEKAAKALEKLNVSMGKATKNDEVAKVEEALNKGAYMNFVNEKGHSLVHVAAAYGALNVLRLLFRSGAAFETINAMKMTPLQACGRNL